MDAIYPSDRQDREIAGRLGKSHPLRAVVAGETSDLLVSYVIGFYHCLRCYAPSSGLWAFRWQYSSFELLRYGNLAFTC